MTASSFKDRSGADTAAFDARMAELDRLPVADESAVERVTRAMAPVLGWHGPVVPKAALRDAARAAIAALKPAPGTGTPGTERSYEH